MQMRKKIIVEVRHNNGKIFWYKNVKFNIKAKIYFLDIRSISQIVISCHGFGGNKDNSTTKKLAESLLDIYNDIAIVSFDWPAHGDDVK